MISVPVVTVIKEVMDTVLFFVNILEDQKRSRSYCCPLLYKEKRKHSQGNKEFTKICKFLSITYVFMYFLSILSVLPRGVNSLNFLTPFFIDL